MSKKRREDIAFMLAAASLIVVGVVMIASGITEELLK